MLELFVNKPFDIQLKNEPSLNKPSKDEVKLKVHLGGICGSDIALFQGEFSHAKYPVRPGHELIGTIVERGDDTPYKVGTRVVVLPNTFCGTCEFCKVGKTNICEHKKSLGINVDGGFAEEFIISSKFIMPIPDDISDELAVLIEPFAVAVSAINKVQITKRHSVAIVGIGSIGIMAAILANHLGAAVTAIDHNAKKHALMKKVDNIKVAYPDEVNDRSFDIVIEAAGTEDAVEKSIQLMKKGGSLVIIGMALKVTLPVVEIVRNDQTVYGSIIYNFPKDFEQTIQYLRDIQFNLKKLISKKYPIQDYKEAYEAAQSGNYVKIVIDFTKK